MKVGFAIRGNVGGHVSGDVGGDVGGGSGYDRVARDSGFKHFPALVLDCLMFIYLTDPHSEQRPLTHSHCVNL